MFNKYLEDLTRNLSIDAAEWMKKTITEAVGPVTRKLLDEAKKQETLTALGFKIGVRRSTDNLSEIISIYRRDEKIASQEFLIKQEENEV